jgi:hypothetical protein
VQPSIGGQQFKTNRQLGTIAKELFHVPDIHIWKSSQLDELRLNLFARIIEADEGLVAKFGQQCIIHTELVER